MEKAVEGGEMDVEEPGSPPKKKQRTFVQNNVVEEDKEVEEEDGDEEEEDGEEEEEEEEGSEQEEEEEVEEEDGNEEEHEIEIEKEEEDEEEGKPLPRIKKINVTIEKRESEEEGSEQEEQEEESEQDEEEEEEGSEQEEEQITNVESNHEREIPDSVGSNKEGAISVTLTDPEVLHCSICLDPFTIPVFQCEKGHAACSSCCNNIDHKCVFCCCPIGYIRCLAIEKVLESVKVRCQNFRYGCYETMSFSKKHEHEKSCISAPCSCPLPDCYFISSFKGLSWHFGHKHSLSPTRFQYNSVFSVSLKLDDKFLVFQEEKNDILFILNNYPEYRGNIVAVNCIKARSLEGRFLYDLCAKTVDSSLILRSVMDSIQKRVDFPPSVGSLLVPFGFFDSGSLLKLKIRIRPLTPEE